LQLGLRSCFPTDDRDRSIWQILLTATHALNDRSLIRDGYRHISFDHVLNRNGYTFSRSGPVVGATYRF